MVVVLGCSGNIMGKKDSLKSLLLRAWRERWDEQAWGIAIKQTLPRGVSGDVYDLATTMLQLSTVGPTFKTIIYRYIKHSLCSGVISHQAVLESVAEFRNFEKVQCVAACLDIVAMVESQVQCRGRQEECLALACSILSLVDWLTALAVDATEALQESADAMDARSELPLLLPRLAAQVDAVARNGFLTALLYLGRLRQPDKALLVTKQLNLLQSQLEVLSDWKSIASNIRSIMEREPGEGVLPSTAPERPLQHSVHCLLQVELTCFRVRPPQAMADRLLLLQQTQGISARDLYYSMVRTCCEGLSRAVGSDMGRYWVQFTYHRLPKLMKCLHAGQPGGAGPAELAAALERLVRRASQQLDLVELQYNRDNQKRHDTLELLLKEMLDSEVLREPDVSRLLDLRGELSRVSVLRQMQASSAQNSSSDSPSSILRADPTVKSILNTMEVQQQDANIPNITKVLFHMLGPSQHLVIGAAVGIGKVQLLMKHLIMLNSLRTSAPADSAAAIRNQAILFEVTFLIVMTTVKNYGLEALPAAGSLPADGGGGAEPFIPRWIRLCYRPPGGRSLQRLTELGDPARFSQLFEQLLTPGANFLTSAVRWDEVCLSAPGFVHWLLLAWADGQVPQETVQAVVDNMNCHWCCLSVCVVVFLNAVLQSSTERLVQKARLMVNMFLAPVSGENLPASAGDQAAERLALAQGIMHHVLDDFLPRDVESRGSEEPAPLLAALRQLWDAGVARGSLSSADVIELRRLLNRGGATWFVDATVTMVLEHPFERERSRAEEMALAVFHLDLPLCALAMANYILTDFFGSTIGHSSLSEPRVACLARLTVTLLLLAVDTAESQAPEYQRLRFQLLMQPAPAAPPTPDALSGDEYERPLAPAAEVAPPALARAVRLIAAQLTVIARDNKWTVWTYFAVQYISEAARRGRCRMHRLLGSLTLATIWQLMCAAPGAFTPDMIVRLLDVSQPAAQKMAAKALCQLHSLQTDDGESLH